MIVLGIETSCDETAVSIIEVKSPTEIKVRGNVVSSQVKLHAEFGGVVPNLAAREHVKNINAVFESALSTAGIRDFKKEIDLIAVTHGPGLGPALLVGITFAKTLAMTHEKPLIGASHMKGHIFSNWLNEDFMEPQFPIMNLLVSGGHTELILMSNYEDFKLIGETMDDAVGEAFDKVARLLGLGYPGGPEISRLAEKGDAKHFPLPRPMLHSKDFNFSFSGLKTAVLYLLRDLKEQNVEIDEQTKSDISASFQEACVDVLVQKTIQASIKHKASAILLSGGVSANTLLRASLKESAEKAGINFSCPPMKYTTDNAVMIALAGYFASLDKNQNTNWEMVDMDANLSF
ncbi:MAG: tRNA (adenosine(37)-N6)-threonylcarbamoyltransferase complex transferase subunit TsaD [Patescibacteria group bacterium]